MYTSMFQNMYVHLLLFRSVFWDPPPSFLSHIYFFETAFAHHMDDAFCQDNWTTTYTTWRFMWFDVLETANCKKISPKDEETKKTEPTRQFIRKKGTKPSTSGCTQELKCTLMCKMRARTRTQANNQKTHRGTENENYKFIWFSAVFMCVCASLFCSLLISFVFSPDCFICWFYFPLVASFFLSFSRRTLERKERKKQTERRRDAERNTVLSRAPHRTSSDRESNCGLFAYIFTHVIYVETVHSINSDNEHDYPNRGEQRAEEKKAATREYICSKLKIEVNQNTHKSSVY